MEARCGATDLSGVAGGSQKTNDASTRAVVNSGQKKNRSWPFWPKAGSFLPLRQNPTGDVFIGFSPDA